MSKNNETSGKKLTFWSFLNDYSIEIPVIQRDYAQGRDDKEALRRNFLASLKGALDKAVKNDDGSKNGDLLLDFIYGSTPEGNEKIYHPLDGQQRLTTLWLLHWYIALRANRLNEDCPESSEICGRLGKFTYETRVSSREFCRELCDPEKFKSFDGIKAKIAEFIKSQTWFHSSWEQDPTISAMLTMLGGSGEGKNDGIEEVFKGVDFESYWDCLTNDSGCPIKFLHQPLHHFGLSDDLYVKMNARGKPLTSFECFKADLIGYIDEKVKEEKDKDEKVGWEKFVKLNTQLTNDDSDKADVPLEIKLDTAWTDIFWKNKSEDFRIDDIYFTFLNRFFMNYRIMDLSGGDEYYEYFNNDTAIVYSSLDDYKWKIGDGEDKGIDIGLFEDLSTILNNYYNFQKGKENEDLMSIFECPWGKKIIPFEFIPTYEGDNVKVAFNGDKKMIQRVVFYAVCKYFQKGEAKEESLRQWMRFVWNLVSVKEITKLQDLEEKDYIRDVDKVKKAIETIDLIVDCHNVYGKIQNLKIEDEDIQTPLYKQLKEEREKVQYIMEREEGREEREDLIKEAEAHSFFHGNIRFLYLNKAGDVDWNRDCFVQKLTNAKKYFPSNSAPTAEPLKILISWFPEDFAERNSSKVTLRGAFGSDKPDDKPNGKELYNNGKSTWRYLLNNELISEPVYNLLMGEGLKRFNIDFEKEKESSNLRVLWMLSQTQLLDYVVKHTSNLHYRVSGGKNEYVEGYEALFNNGFRILMGPANGEGTIEALLKNDKVEDNIIELYRKLSKRGHFLCQYKENGGWGDFYVLVDENKLREVDDYVDEFKDKG